MKPSPDDLQHASHPLDQTVLTPLGPITAREVIHHDVVKQSVAERKDKRLRRLNTHKALALYAQGLSTRDIAESLGLAPITVVGYMRAHRRAIEAADIDTDLDQIAVPLAADNLIHGLMAGDKTYTLETLKGRGKLRRYSQADDHVSHDLPELVVRFEGGPAAGPGVPGSAVKPQDVVEGQILGRVLLPVMEPTE